MPIGTNATPNYQDISFKFNFGKSKIGQFTLFGIGGKSDIDFLHNEIDEADLFAAADEDSFAKSLFGVIGLKHNLIIDHQTYLRTIVGVSTSQNKFNQDRFFNLGEANEFNLPFFETDNVDNRYTLSSFVNRKFNKRFTARTGILMERSNSDLFLRIREGEPDLNEDGQPDWRTAYDFEEGMTLLQAFVQTQYRLNPKWTINTGLHGQLLTLNNLSLIHI